MNETNRFRTTFEIPTSKIRLGYSDKVLWMGSCFTENLGLWLQNHGLESRVNTFGILYNPFSIAASLKKIIENYCYEDAELEAFNNRFISFDHHGRFSGTDKEQVLKDINDSIQESHALMKDANWLFITLGSAWAFQRKSNGKIVANCHKIPGTAFERVFLSAEKMAEEWRALLDQLKAFNPSLQVVFTVSPVRHWRDGAVQNQRSKAALISLIHQLVEENDYCSYFPAYELMMDDLRDYRFYGDDMLHPSDVAVEYIRERFLMTYFDDSDLATYNKMTQLVKATEHRISNSDKEATRNFLLSQLEQLKQLKTVNPAPKTSHLEIKLKWKLSKLG